MLVTFEQPGQGVNMEKTHDTQIRKQTYQIMLPSEPFKGQLAWKGKRKTHGSMSVGVILDKRSGKPL